MKLTREHKKKINQAAREVCALHHVEVAWRYCTGESIGDVRHDHRSCTKHMNLCFFEERDCSTDLDDTERLANVKEIEDHPSGKVELDLYIYQRYYWGHSVEPELFGNITAEFQNGQLLRVYDPLEAVRRESSAWLAARAAADYAKLGA